MRLAFIILALATFIHSGFTQSATDSIKIDQIVITGNSKTKDHIIKRELDFKEGDQLAIADTNNIFLLTRNKLFNTDLFITTAIEFSNDTLSIKVKERWYVFPFPIIELADRNFNEWWQQRGRDFKRLQYGLRLYHNNMRGRNEKLKLVLQQGFTPKYELFYTIPYINNKLKTGVKFSLSYSQNKQVAYATVNHKLEYLESDQYIRKRFYSGISFLQRKRYYTSHQVDLLYKNNAIGDTITDLNPNYFLNKATSQQYFEIGYTIDHDKRDIQYYPLKGYRLKLEVKKLGIGIIDDINLWQLYGSGSVHKTLKSNYFIGTSLKFKASNNNLQPFSNFRALGYNEHFVRGYELFPTDGQHYLLSRSEFKKRIFNKEFNFKLPFTHFSKAPFSTYLKLFTDYGYVVDNTLAFQNGKYSNTNLIGYGIGLDFVTYYDLVFRVEYSLTRHDQSGLFLHFEAAF